MEMKYKIIFFIFLTFTNYLINKPILNKKTFSQLIKISKNYINNHINSIALEQNESGFFRLNIPTNESLINDLSNKKFFLSKVRLNFWPKNAIFLEESIHNHPRYFESYLINGSYEHEIWNISEEEFNSEPHNSFKIIKNIDQKSFIYSGIINLKLKEKQEISKGNIIPFDKNLIHRVIKTKENSLSINVVFNSKENNSIYKLPFYNVYLKNENIINVKTTRNTILGEESQHQLKEILKLI